MRTPPDHANVIIARDFFTVVTATFQTLYVVRDPGSSRRRIVHTNVTAHPNLAIWRPTMN